MLFGKTSSIQTIKYLIWDYLLKSEKVNGNEFLKKCIDYRFKEYPKKRGEQKMFLSSAISLYIFSIFIVLLFILALISLVQFGSPLLSHIKTVLLILGGNYYGF
jgi:hypothetical protein